MKKIWIYLLISLLVCAMLSTDALATTETDDNATEWIEDDVPVTPLEEDVEISPDIDLVSEPELTDSAQYEYDTASFESSLFSLGEYEAAPVFEASLSDFTVTRDRKTLTKYTGSESVVSIPAGYGITTIGSWAFKDTPVTSVIVPEGVTTLESNAFKGASLLTTVKLPSTLVNIGVFAFDDCSSLESISIPGSVIKISSYTFQDCYNLQSVSLGNGVSIIENGAFANCVRLSSISLPSSLRTIGDYVFHNCDGLTSMTIPEGVTTIGRSILWDCNNLTTVTMPKSVTSIGSGIFQSSKNATMRVYYNSYAQQYCETNKVNHTVIDAPHIHTIVTDAAVAATCTTSGLTEGSHCASCGTVLVAQKEIPATGHSPVTDAAVAATTLSSGLTEGSHCSVCGEVFVAQQTIPQIAIHMSRNASKKANVGDSFGIVVDGKTVKSYKSSDKKIATVSRQGVVTAKKAGTAKITISLSNRKKLTLKVKVADPYAPTRVQIAQGKKYSLKVGATLQLSAALTPSTAKSSLKWSSGNKAVASVSKNGLVKAKKAGSVKITVTTSNKKKATITIKVVK